MRRVHATASVLLAQKLGQRSELSLLLPLPIGVYGNDGAEP